MTLEQLIKAMRTSSEPPHKLEREIAKVAGWRKTDRGWASPDGVTTRMPPRFTETIDQAARARPPGYSYQVRESGAHGGGDAKVWDWRMIPSQSDYTCPMAPGPGRSPAMALCIACMLAWQGHIAQQQNGRTTP